MKKIIVIALAITAFALPAMATHASQSFQIVVKPNPISITSTPPDCSQDTGNCFVGDPYSYQVVAVCAPGCVGPLVYSSTGFPLTLTIDAATGLVSGNLPADPNAFNPTITVTDSNGNNKVTQPLAPPKPQ